MKDYASIIFLFLLFFNDVANSETNTEKFENLLDKIKNEGTQLLNLSLDSFSLILNDIEKLLDEEIRVQ